MNNTSIFSLEFTEIAINKVKNLISNENNPNIGFRVYITGGGCSGFQYGFTFDEKVHNDDFIFKKNNIKLIVDGMSLQYLTGGIIDYSENLEGSRFTVNNPNAKTTCSCGYSFSI